ncbi:uncharacterized protein BN471_00931 [Paraprevotella clara CAG:116]|nr:uncharacterized protein BN471_00931 [Paraprevotella clara CAG:116]
MMARHAQISQQTVQLFYAVITHPVLQIPEIAPDKCETSVSNDIRLGICILVKTIQMPGRIQSGHNRPAMPSAPKGDIGIYPGRIDHQTVYTFFQQDRDVINCFFHQYFTLREVKGTNFQRYIHLIIIKYLST